MKTIDPVKDVKTKEEKLKLFIDTFKAPKQGDINPKTGNKYTVKTAKDKRDAMRNNRKIIYEAYYGINNN